MDIIDTRFRPATADTIQGILDNPLYQQFSAATRFVERPRRTLAEEVAMLRELGVVRAVVTGRDVSSTVDTPSTNPGMFESIAAYPDFFIGFYGLDPHPGMATLRAFRRAVRERNVKGGSIDPGMARLPADDARYYPLYAACCEENIPMAVTTGASSGMPGVILDHMAPRRIDKVATDFPELRLVISHGGYPWITEAVAVAARHANVYLDFSASWHMPQVELYVQAANGPLRDKMLFASAHPFDHIRDTLDFYAGLPLTDEVRQRVMYANAAMLLGLA